MGSKTGGLCPKSHGVIHGKVKLLLSHAKHASGYYSTLFSELIKDYSMDSFGCLHILLSVKGVVCMHRSHDLRTKSFLFGQAEHKLRKFPTEKFMADVRDVSPLCLLRKETDKIIKVILTTIKENKISNKQFLAFQDLKETVEKGNFDLNLHKIYFTLRNIYAKIKEIYYERRKLSHFEFRSRRTVYIDVSLDYSVAPHTAPRINLKETVCNQEVDSASFHLAYINRRECLKSLPFDTKSEWRARMSLPSLATPSKCCVCLEEFSHVHSRVILSGCRHFLCIICTLTLVEKKQLCPMCRSPFKDFIRAAGMEMLKVYLE